MPVERETRRDFLFVVLLPASAAGGRRLVYFSCYLDTNILKYTNNINGWSNFVWPNIVTISHDKIVVPLRFWLLLSAIFRPVNGKLVGPF